MDYDLNFSIQARATVDSIKRHPEVLRKRQLRGRYRMSFIVSNAIVFPSHLEMLFSWLR